MLWATTGWPILGGCLLMIAAAAINTRRGRVPNTFTYPAATLGLLLAIVYGERGLYPSLHGGIGSSLGAAAITFLVLLILWRWLRLGGGSLKIQTAFAAWVGCALPFEKALILSLTAIAAIALAYLLAVIATRLSGGTEEEGPVRYACLTQTQMAFLTIGTVVVSSFFGLA